jgi:hypothetical protein
LTQTEKPGATKGEGKDERRGTYVDFKVLVDGRGMLYLWEDDPHPDITKAMFMARDMSEVVREAFGLKEGQRARMSISGKSILIVPLAESEPA